MDGRRSNSSRLPRYFTLLLLTFTLAAKLNNALTLFGAANAADKDVYDDESYEDFDDIDEEEGEEEDEGDDEMYWDEEDEYESEEWENPPNVTADELDVITSVADYMSSVHYLLWDINMNKEQRVAAVVLEESWVPVKRDAVAVMAAATVLPGNRQTAVACAADAEQEARKTLLALHDAVADCYKKDKTISSHATDGDDDGVDAAAAAAEVDAVVQRDATEFMALALGALRATPLVGGAETADLVSSHERGAEALSAHAELLERRGRRRRAAVRRCVDLCMEQAYAEADKAREALAACVLHLGEAPPGADPHNEL